MHYQPLLPPPHYASLMEYQHGLKQIGHRLQTHLTRKASRDTGSYWEWADAYSPRQAEADKLALRARCWHLFEPEKCAAVLPERKGSAKQHQTPAIHTPDTQSLTLTSRFNR
ncbi:hypothetical protein [Aeromonas sanarellii]|uniref:hypothetical protein n=1 Tax=Aeromonas sanarellii TaxID=633415 RepID=UPI003BA19D1B